MALLDGSFAVHRSLVRVEANGDQGTLKHLVSGKAAYTVRMFTGQQKSPGLHLDFSVYRAG
jgi:hypothetical protein